MLLRPSSSGKGLGLVYGRCQVQVPMGTKERKRGKKSTYKKKTCLKFMATWLIYMVSHEGTRVHGFPFPLMCTFVTCRMVVMACLLVYNQLSKLLLINLHVALCSNLQSFSWMASLNKAKYNMCCNHFLVLMKSFHVVNLVYSLDPNEFVICKIPRLLWHSSGAIHTENWSKWIILFALASILFGWYESNIMDWIEGGSLQSEIVRLSFCKDFAWDIPLMSSI